MSGCSECLTREIEPHLAAVPHRPPWRTAPIHPYYGGSDVAAAAGRRKAAGKACVRLLPVSPFHQAERLSLIGIESLCPKIRRSGGIPGNLPRSLAAGVLGGKNSWRTRRCWITAIDAQALPLNRCATAERSERRFVSRFADGANATVLETRKKLLRAGPSCREICASVSLDLRKMRRREISAKRWICADVLDALRFGEAAGAETDHRQQGNITARTIGICAHPVCRKAVCPWTLENYTYCTGATRGTKPDFEPLATPGLDTAPLFLHEPSLSWCLPTVMIGDVSAGRCSAHAGDDNCAQKMPPETETAARFLCHPGTNSRSGNGWRRINCVHHATAR